MKGFLRRRWTLGLTVALAIAAGALAVVIITVLPSEPATSEPGSPVARFDITPLPFPGYGTVEPPDYSNPPRCTAPDDERPAPELPALPCHYSGAEPPPGAIPTATPGDVRLPQNAPAGWQVVDNPMFRFTLVVPPDWYVNMRPEGGEFYVLDPVALEQEATGEGLPGGVLIHFSAQVWRESPFVRQAQHLDEPNATFGDYQGAIWDEGPGEGLAHFIHAVFVKDGVLFSAAANIGEGLPTTDAEVATVQQILASVTPY